MKTPEDDNLTAVAADLRHALDNMLAVLQALARGDSDQVMETTFPVDHPVGALAASLNEVASALNSARAERKQRESALKERIALIEQQKKLIVELSTPVIEVWTGVLALPLIGVFDTERATKTTSELLESVVALRAFLVVLDVTGIEMVDTSVADHLLRMARAVRLLGAECVLSGVQPAMSRTIVSMGIEIGDVRTFHTLGSALQTTTASVSKARSTPTRR